MNEYILAVASACDLYALFCHWPHLLYFRWIVGSVKENQSRIYFTAHCNLEHELIEKNEPKKLTIISLNMTSMHFFVIGHICSIKLRWIVGSGKKNQSTIYFKGS